ncbi:MAG: phosphatase PAP2 family protein [Deltaproteobacteria bacterium]|nr:phosphatase PAP2 family protein [Deltaproteobacteria bacterium]
MKWNWTDKITLLYNLFLVIFVITFRAKIGNYACHIVFNLGIISGVILFSRAKKHQPLMHIFHLWYPIFLYTFLYYQTGLLNRVVIPNFIDDLFLRLDVAIFGKFPGFILYGGGGNAMLDEVFHFFYFSYYLLIPVTGIMLHRKNEEIFNQFVFQISSLFYICYVIYIFIPVEGPIELRNIYYHDRGLFRQVVDFIYKEGENPGAAFPSSHVAVTFLVAWWGSKHFDKAKICYWLIFLFLSLATIYCMFHYAVDVFGGILLAALVLLLFKTLGGRKEP